MYLTEEFALQSATDTAKNIKKNKKIFQKLVKNA